MLGNDVQLFYKLLDSLSTSLRDLAVKYELLVSASMRQASDRERTDAAVMDMAREVTSSFASMAKDFDQLKDLATAGREHDVRFSAAVQSMSKTMESLDSKMAAVTASSDDTASIARDGKSVMIHVDGHMDGFGNQLAAILAASADVVKMMKVVEEMKQQFEPFRKLAVLLSKPVAIVVAIYVIFVTIVAAIEGCQKVNEIRSKVDGNSVTNETAKTTQTIQTAKTTVNEPN